MSNEETEDTRDFQDRMWEVGTATRLIDDMGCDYIKPEFRRDHPEAVEERHHHPEAVTLRTQLERTKEQFRQRMEESEEAVKWIEQLQPAIATCMEEMQRIFKNCEVVQGTDLHEEGLCLYTDTEAWGCGLVIYDPIEAVEQLRELPLFDDHSQMLDESEGWHDRTIKAHRDWCENTDKQDWCRALTENEMAHGFCGVD